MTDFRERCYVESIAETQVWTPAPLSWTFELVVLELAATESLAGENEDGHRDRTSGERRSSQSTHGLMRRRRGAVGL